MRRWAVRASFVALVASRPSLAADFYVDPKTGSAQGDGSADNPWQSLEEVVSANLIESRDWESLPYTSGSKLVAKNAGAPVKAGDTIWLRSGYHGAVSIVGYYNETPITIAAQEGHTPELKSLTLRSGENFTVRGLFISPAYAPSYDKDTLVTIESHNHSGPISKILIENCQLSSVDDISGWSAADWNDKAANGLQVGGSEITIRNNTVRNVNFGISVGASDSLITGNVVDNFAGDGLRGLGDHTTFEYNTVKNCYKVNDNHDDGFQSWSRGADGSVGTGEVVGVVLRGNRIINYENENQPLRCTLQGIGLFDGTFVDWVIENNVIMVDHWHGITLLGARGARVANNTVMDLNPEKPGPPWIKIAPHKNGTDSENCEVFNNLATDIANEGNGVAEENNLVIGDPAALFVDPSNHDLHLLPDAPAIDMGRSQLAPELDADRIPRPQGAGIDVGAFEWHDGSVQPVGGSGGASGASGRGGAGNASSGGAAAADDADDDGGCGCRSAGAKPGREAALWLAFGLIAGCRRRRRE